MCKTKLLAVVGPTASGKSSLAVSIAEKFDGEIVSCDSMQIYKGFGVATAVPTEEEMRSIKHHLLSFAEPDSSFSVVQYCELAQKCINDISARGKLPILCGGTGLYYNSLVDGITFSDVEGSDEIRRELELRIAQEGGQALLDELSKIDPQYAAKLAPADHKRVIRAFEVYRATGVTMSEHIRLSRQNDSDYELFVIGLGFNDREVLYDRINKRVDLMLENGLIAETIRFYSSCPSHTAVQAIGYKEMKPFIDGQCSLETAVENLKRATRRYAKRQLSWFRRDDRINWFNADEYSDYNQLLNDVCVMAEEVLYGTEK